MRIVSKFSDYYDSLQAHGADDRLLMLRATVEHTDKEPAWRSLFTHFERCFTHEVYDRHEYQQTRKWGALIVETGIVIFVGRPYLFFKTQRCLKAFGSVPEVRYIYKLDEIDALVQEHDHPSIYERGRQSRWQRRWIRGNSKSWALSTWELANSKEFTAFAVEQQAPIIHIGGRGWAHVYPRLADFQFYKAVEPWQAYQELSMFLGNIAAPDRVPVTISDKDRVNQHGFDMKYGFRKRPKDE